MTSSNNDGHRCYEHEEVYYNYALHVLLKTK